EEADMFNRWSRTIRIATGSVLTAVIVSSSGCRLTPGPQEEMYESNALEPLPSPLLQARGLTQPSRAGDEFHDAARADVQRAAEGDVPQEVVRRVSRL